MPTSVFQVEVDDTKFNEFQKKVEEHQQTLDELPEAWREVNDEIGNSKTPIGMLIAAVAAIEAHTKAIIGQQSQFNRGAETSSRSMASLGNATKAVASHIKEATANLLRWASVTTAITGLLGVGGLFGIERLAVRSSTDTRQAQGLGISVGQSDAFRINYGRYVNSDSLLGNVVNAQHDQEKMWAFGAMGMNPSQAMQANPAELASQMVLKAKDVFERTGGTEQGAKAGGLLEFFTMDELRRIAQTSKRDLAASADAYGRDKNALDLDPVTQKRWQNFNTQLDRAGDSIEKAFIIGLTPLTGPLTELSAAFTDLVTSALANPNLKGWIEDFAAGIHRFADYLSTPQFKTDIEDFFDSVKKFIHYVEDAAKGVEGITKRFGWGTPFSPGGPGLMRDRPTGDRPDKDDPRSYAHNPHTDDPRGFGIYLNPYSAAADPVRKDEFAGNETMHALPAGMLANMYQMESSQGRDPTSHVENSAHAMGPYQFTPDAARQYGLMGVDKNGKAFDNRDDLRLSADAAARYMADLLKEFHSDNAKALAGYNWGQGNVETDIKEHGDKWADYAPKETRKYVADGINNLGPNRGVVVTINNNAGANVHVSTNNLASPTR